MCEFNQNVITLCLLMNTNERQVIFLTPSGIILCQSEEKMIRLSLILSLLLILPACSGETEMAQLTPMAGTMDLQQDPPDSALFTKIDTYLAGQRGPRNARYDYARIDLNGDGMRDALVLFKLPHTYWCDWGGCTMTIFEARDNGFVLRSEMTNVRGPVMISHQKTQGWRDILFRVSGINAPDRNIVMAFNRGAYPVNPAGAPAYNGRLNDVNGDRLFP